MDSLPETNIFAPENGWLVQMKSPFGAFRPIFRIKTHLLVSGSINLGGGLVSNMFWNFHPDPWGRLFPILTVAHIFERGWELNHQLEMVHGVGGNLKTPRHLRRLQTLHGLKP